MKDFDITGAARAAEAELIALRRELHRIPEYGDTLPPTRTLPPILRSPKELIDLPRHTRKKGQRREK